MSDLIERQAAIALAKDIVVPHKDGYDYHHKSVDPLDIMELPAVDNWIPVSERLPEESGLYLVTRHSYIGSKLNYTDIVCYGYPEDGKRRKNRVWYFHDSEYGDISIAFDKVIAWRDLPQPYEEEKK